MPDSAARQVSWRFQQGELGCLLLALLRSADGSEIEDPGCLTSSLLEVLLPLLRELGAGALQMLHLQRKRFCCVDCPFQQAHEPVSICWPRLAQPLTGSLAEEVLQDLDV